MLLPHSLISFTVLPIKNIYEGNFKEHRVSSHVESTPEPLVVQGRPLLVHRRPLVVHGRPLVVHGRPLVVHGRPLVVHGRLLVVHGLVHGRPLVAHGLLHVNNRLFALCAVTPSPTGNLPVHRLLLTIPCNYFSVKLRLLNFKV
uniref:Uncharacterized protein n=1 Tax=Xiphophorus maculatus TaxID=8083 RepID=A0A3B5QUP7_XIPMA